MIHLDFAARMCYAWLMVLIAFPHMKISGKRVIQAIDSDLSQELGPQQSPEVLSRRVRKTKPEMRSFKVLTESECAGKVVEDWPPSTIVTTPSNWTNEAIEVLNSVRRKHGQKQNLGNLVKDDELCKMAQFCSNTFPLLGGEAEVSCTLEKYNIKWNQFLTGIDYPDSYKVSDAYTWINHLQYHEGHTHNMEGLKREAEVEWLNNTDTAKAHLLDPVIKFVCVTVYAEAGNVYGYVIYRNAETKDESQSLIPSTFVLFVTFILSGLVNT